MLSQAQGMQIVEKLVDALLADVKVISDAWKLVEEHMQLELKRKWCVIIQEELKKLGEKTITTTTISPHTGEVPAMKLYPNSDGSKTWHGPGVDKTDKPFPTSDGKIPVGDDDLPKDHRSSYDVVTVSPKEQKAADKAEAKQEAWEAREEKKEEERKERLAEDREAAREANLKGKAKR